jgi:hypothetical protein
MLPVINIILSLIDRINDKIYILGIYSFFT